ncbi:hypothetical protein KP509_18G073100 [Ceratopteris richardii]|uniref:AIR9-like A9 domain-containing protein n=1 Tax=Ceratopteris richardii TaxID=49495 RepID=A0A8T2SSU4_CERRI|nr:hypothetical protein KP509_18G073100 [Ceratopteris richardii]
MLLQVSSKRSMSMDDKFFDQDREERDPVSFGNGFHPFSSNDLSRDSEKDDVYSNMSFPADYCIYSSDSSGNDNLQNTLLNGDCEMSKSNVSNEALEGDADKASVYHCMSYLPSSESSALNENGSPNASELDANTDTFLDVASILHEDDSLLVHSSLSSHDCEHDEHDECDLSIMGQRLKELPFYPSQGTPHSTQRCTPIGSCDSHGSSNGHTKPLAEYEIKAHQHPVHVDNNGTTDVSEGQESMVHHLANRKAGPQGKDSRTDSWLDDYIRQQDMTINTGKLSSSTKALLNPCQKAIKTEKRNTKVALSSTRNLVVERSQCGVQSITISAARTYRPLKTSEVLQLHSQNSNRHPLERTSFLPPGDFKRTAADSVRLWKAYANASFSTCVKLPSSSTNLIKAHLASQTKSQFTRSVSELTRSSSGSPKKSIPSIQPAKKNLIHSQKKSPLIADCTNSTHSSFVSITSKPPPFTSIESNSSTPIIRAPKSAAFARLIALPLVNSKAREDVRLDLRGQKVKSLDCNLVNLTAKLEFVYLRDNKLSHLAGIEILRRVKVLDLSFNEFKAVLDLNHLASCKALQQLYLAGNQLTSLSSLPQLPNLEFLSVAQNKLKDLTMGSQPKLQVLAASKNKISTFKGFPHFPSLEHLRLEENPISDMEHVKVIAILLVGPSLKKFNNRDLTLEEQESACRYPPHAGLCLRDGWFFCSADIAFASTMKFLAEQWAERIPPGYTFEQAFIDQPFEDYPCKCHFIVKHQSTSYEDLDLKLQYKWYIGDKIPTDFVPIQGANKQSYWPKRKDIGYCLKAECVLILGDVEYAPIFAVSFPVLPGTGCPKVIELKIQGEFTEGNIIKGQVKVACCGGTATKGIVSWLRHDESSSPRMVPGAEDMEYFLSLEDVGTKLILMYTPLTKEGVKGEPYFATTEIIKPGIPSVTDLRVIGRMVEGNTIRGIGYYFGGKEGLSKIEWLQEVEGLGTFQLISEGSSELTLTEKDVGLRLLFQYTPVNSEGIEGIAVSIVTEKVSRAPPRITSLRIVGELSEGGTVYVNAVLSGGAIEGASFVQWSKTLVSNLSDCSIEMDEIGTSIVPENFRIPFGCYGVYLAAEYTPVLEDGTTGEKALVVSSAPIKMLPPMLTSLSITGEYIEGETLVASYNYVGGREGNSKYGWFLHEEKDDPGAPIVEAAGNLEYTITKPAINKIVSFKCTPIREDGCIGEERHDIGQGRVLPGTPRLLSLGIVGDPVEDSHLCIAKSYFGGVEGTPKIQWFQIESTGYLKRIEGATSPTYTVTLENVESSLCVSYEPCRSDGVMGFPVLSLPFGPISPAVPTCETLELLGDMIEGESLKFSSVYKGGVKGQCTNQWFRETSDGSCRKIGVRETIRLTLEDVGCCIKLIYTPIRNDGVAGIPKIVSSAHIKAVPNGCEDEEMIPQKVYFGGIEGDSEFTWFRVEERFEGCIDFNEAQVVGKSE